MGRSSVIDALSFYRVGRWCLRRHVPVVPRAMEGLGLVLCNASVSPRAEIGAGTLLGYRGLGIVIHAQARVGSNVVIGPQVTVGARAPHPGCPVIGNDVFIGTGAKILGGIRIGDGAVIGANAVVIDDVPSHCMAAGVPARIIRRDIDRLYYGSNRGVEMIGGIPAAVVSGTSSDGLLTGDSSNPE
jgi:serine O-acetyltransferase